MTGWVIKFCLLIVENKKLYHNIIFVSSLYLYLCSWCEANHSQNP